MGFSVLLFQGRAKTAQPAKAPGVRMPAQLNRLFRLVPKTDTHLHLAGSARRVDIETFMLENGLSKAEISQEMRLIKPSYKNLTDFLVTYYRIPRHVFTPSQFKRAVVGIIRDAAKENVRILEIRTSALNKGGPPEAIIQAVEEGMREGMAWVKATKGYDMQTCLIVLAQRAGSPADSLRHAKLAVKLARCPGSLIRGFDVAGDEIKHSIEKHVKAIRYIKKHGKPLGLSLTIHAGEVPISENISGLDSIRKAVQYGADRIGHCLQADADPLLKRYLIRKQTPIELCPWSNVQTMAVKSYTEHPIRRYLEKGLNVSLATDNRLVSQVTLTRQLGQLWRHGLITGWEQIKRLTLNGIQSSFIPQKEKLQVEQEVLRIFDSLEKRFRQTIRIHLQDKGTNQREKGA